jgi:competence protein ComGC
MEASPPQQPPETAQPPAGPVGPWPQGPPPGYDPSQGGAYPYGPPQPGPYPYGPPQKSKGFPVWAIVLIVAAVLIPVMGILAAIAIPMFVMQNEKAKDSSVKEGGHMILIGIGSWAIDHGDVYPEAAQVTADGDVGMMMQQRGESWPTNPWTGGPMEQGTSRGDYRYEPAADGSDYEFLVFLSDGQALKMR